MVGAGREPHADRRPSTVDLRPSAAKRSRPSKGVRYLWPGMIDVDRLPRRQRPERGVRLRAPGARRPGSSPRPAEVATAERIILPGVGAARATIDSLVEQDLVGALARPRAGRPHPVPRHLHRPPGAVRPQRGGRHRRARLGARHGPALPRHRPGPPDRLEPRAVHPTAPPHRRRARRRPLLLRELLLLRAPATPPTRWASPTTPSSSARWWRATTSSPPSSTRRRAARSGSRSCAPSRPGMPAC